MVVLAPSAHGPAVLVRAEPGPPPSGSAPLRLPTVTTEPEPGGPALVAALESLLGPVTVLRANAVEWDESSDATLLLAEVEPLAAPAPPGLAWADLDAAAGELVEPRQTRGAVLRWIDERDGGWSPLRPPWSRPGWAGRAGAWMRERMAANGYADPGPVALVQLWGLSVVLSADSARGRAFFKSSSGLFRHEAALTARLAELTPELVPEVLAVDEDEGWLLMADLGGTETGERGAPEWAAGLTAHAALQQAWEGRTATLLAAGAPSRPLDELADWVRAAHQDDGLMGRLGPDLREAWDAATPTFADCCRRLAEIGPEPTLVHGDLHPWNVSVGPGGVRVFDWTDGAVSHPFVDLVTYVPRIPDEASRRALLDGYLARWSDHLGPDELARAGELALVAGSLYQVRTYRTLLPTLLPDDQGSMRDGDLSWVRRSLRRLESGLAGTY